MPAVPAAPDSTVVDDAMAVANGAHDDAVDATSAAVTANDAAIAAMEEKLKEAEEAQKAKTAENAKMEADRFAAQKALEDARKKEHDSAPKDPAESPTP